MPCRFLSTPSARRATAVHIGSELCHDISIHALREEGDPPPDFGLITIPIFLSTPSARRATTREIRRTKRQFYFYPRPPRGGRPAQLSPAQHPQHFYPRPPRGGRHSFQNPGVPPYEFLSTPSARRATQHSLATVIHIRISIHALREEGDALRTPTITTTSDFYPRPPRGGRQGRNIGLQEAIQFLSTPSARRATPSGYGRVEPSEFLSTPSARRATLSGQRP